MFVNAVGNRFASYSLPVNNKPKLPPFGFDSVSFSGNIKTNAPDFSEKRVAELYLGAVSNFYKDNPILKDINYKTPKLIFKANLSDDTLAEYNALSNKISLSNKYEKDFYGIAFANKKGELTSAMIFIEDDLDSNLKEMGLDPEAVKREGTLAVKLTDEEKEAMIEATFAHELRHSLQHHLILSTKGAREKYLFELDRVISLYERILSKAKEDPSTPINIKAFDSEIRKMKRCYSKRYIPKKLLEDDAKLKFSTNRYDKRYLSVNNHLLPSTVIEDMKILGEDVPNKAMPVEIDAYNYEMEYTYNYLQDKIRPAVMVYMLGYSKDVATKGPDYMMQYDFSPMILC